jgi:hypothetical protein
MEAWWWSRRRVSYHGGGGVDAISAASAMRVAGTSAMPSRVLRVGVGGLVSGGEGLSFLRVAGSVKQEGMLARVRSVRRAQSPSPRSCLLPARRAHWARFLLLPLSPLRRGPALPCTWTLHAGR